MIIFGTRTKVLEDPNSLILNCGYCGTQKSVYIFKQVKYFHIFWIPVFPYSNTFASHCTHCKKVSYQNEFPAENLQEIRQSFQKKTPIGYYSGLIIIGLLFLFAIVAGISNSISKEKYIKNPQLGDVYEVEHKSNTGSFYTLFRINDIKQDSISFDINDYQVNKSSKLSKLKRDYKNEYTDKITLAKTEIDSMYNSKLIKGIDG